MFLSHFLTVRNGTWKNTSLAFRIDVTRCHIHGKFYLKQASKKKEEWHDRGFFNIAN